MCCGLLLAAPESVETQHQQTVKSLQAAGEDSEPIHVVLRQEHLLMVLKVFVQLEAQQFLRSLTLPPSGQFPLSPTDGTSVGHQTQVVARSR